MRSKRQKVLLEMDLRKYRSFWLDWFGPVGREIGSSKRWFTDDPSVFIIAVEDRISTRSPFFMSVQPFRAQNVVFGLEKVFFNFDSKTETPNWKVMFGEVCGLTKQLKERFDAEPLIVRTWRGFHVYVFLKDIAEFSFGQESTYNWMYWRLQEELLKGVPHLTLDTKCLGNLKQLTRIPYSTQEEGMECLPVNLNCQPVHIENLDVYRERGIPQDLFRQLTEKAQEILRKKIDNANLSKEDREKAIGEYIEIAYLLLGT